MRVAACRLLSGAAIVLCAGTAAAQTVPAETAATTPTQATVPSRPAATTPARSVAPAAPQTVDDIIVTAQKREQSLQDVPIVVTVVGQQALQDAGVRDLRDLTILTPGLLVTSSSSEVTATARIRGVGTAGDNYGLESSVGIMIDGVYRPRAGVALGDLGELQRVEVLKGPQGTLFGKNATAGVINIVTRRPSFTFGGIAEGTVSNYGGYGASLSVTGPLIDDLLAARVFVVRRKRDGFLTVRNGVGPRTRTDDQNQDFYSIRTQFLLTPAPGLDITLIGDVTRRREDCCASLQLKENGTTQDLVRALDPISGGLAIPPDPFARIAYANSENTLDVNDQGLALEMNWQTPWLNSATLTSVSGLRHWRRTGGIDGDGTSADILVFEPTYYYQQYNQFSQEVRYAGRTDRLDWLVGGYYAAEHQTQDVTLQPGRQFEDYASLLYSGGTNIALVSQLLGRPRGTSYVSGRGQLDFHNQRENNFALFTNETVKLTDRFEITGGLRYTIERKNLTTQYYNSDGGLGCATLRARVASGAIMAAQAAGPAGLLCTTFFNPSFNNLVNNQRLAENRLTGTAKASFRFNPGLLTYLSYARGYKAGGLNLDRLACSFAGSATCGPSLQPVLDTSFKPEFVDSYELGAKSTLLNRRLLLNGTLFYQRFSDYQLNIFNGVVFTVSSVPKVISKGVDLDFNWFATHSLNFQGGLTIADTRYPLSNQSVLGPKCTFLPAGGVVSQGTPTGCSLLPGSRLPLAPLYSASLSGTYSRAVTAGTIGRLSVTGKYLSTYNTGSDLNPTKVQQGYLLVNTRVGIGTSDERLMFELWSNNVFDQDYVQVGFESTLQSRTTGAFLGLPRTYGATLRVRF